MRLTNPLEVAVMESKLHAVLETYGVKDYISASSLVNYGYTFTFSIAIHEVHAKLEVHRFL